MRALSAALMICLAGCAALQPRAELRPARVSGVVLEVIPRLALAEMEWEFAVLLETAGGDVVTVYIEEGGKDLRLGQHVEVRGMWVEAGVIVGELLPAPAPEGPDV